MQSFEPGLAGLIPELRWRGMFHAASDGLEARLASGKPICGYNGFDPSGPWLHIGHLIPIFGLLHLQRHGGRPIVVVGGGTGMIGDPSGRSSERNLLDRTTIDANVEIQRRQFERLLDFSGSDGALLVNNLDWLEPIHLLEWLRDVGKHFTIPYMLAKDSVQLRLERGLSFTEFSYMLIQATDFSHLHRTMGVELQMGGADQWGNLTAGLELIRRETPFDAAGAQPGGVTGDVGDGVAGDDAAGSPVSSARGAFALAYPLLLSPSGAKFGKTEGGDSVWLHPDGTTPYAFYQHWLNTDDRDVPVYLRWFTTKSPGEVDQLEAEVADHPERRTAQRELARDVTARVHGEEAAKAAERGSVQMFGFGAAHVAIEKADAKGREELFRSMQGSFTVDAVISVGPVATVLADREVLTSRSEVRRLIANGGLVINGQKITDPHATMPPPIDGEWWEIRIGKRRVVLARLEKD